MFDPAVDYSVRICLPYYTYPCEPLCVVQLVRAVSLVTLLAIANRLRLATFVALCITRLFVKEGGECSMFLKFEHYKTCITTRTCTYHNNNAGSISHRRHGVSHLRLVVLHDHDALPSTVHADNITATKRHTVTPQRPSSNPSSCRRQRSAETGNHFSEWGQQNSKAPEEMLLGRK